MKRSIISIIVSALLIGMLCSCGVFTKPEPKEPELSQMRTICELAVMKCYYHNVAKYYEEDASGFLFWSKDKHFWMEYDGIVTLGIDASRLSVEIQDTTITVTIPPAEVMGCKVDASSLTPESYIVEQGSAHITAEDETQAIREAQQSLEETSKSDKSLLSQAQQRAKALIEDYITNLGKAVGVSYTVKWNYLPDDQQKAESSDTEIEETEVF